MVRLILRVFEDNGSCGVSMERASGMGALVVVEGGKWRSCGQPERVVRRYHLGQNNYSFDALQAYCFGINLKL